MKKTSRAKKPSAADLSRDSLKLLDARRIPEAVEMAGQALMADPSSDILRLRYAHVLDSTMIHSDNPEIRKCLTLCMKSQTIDRQKIGRNWGTLLLKAPLYRFLMEEQDERAYWKGIDSLLNDDFFLIGLDSIIVITAVLETAMIKLRRNLLDASRTEGRLRGKHLRLLCAMATQCFFNEYVWQEQPEETALIEALDPADPVRIALLGCYRPLCAHPQAQDWVTPHGTGPLKDLLRLHVENHFKEQAEKPLFKSFSEIEHETSLAVQAMYEENPYPRWRTVDISPVQYSDVTPDWLSAGCGTGKPMTQIALAFPNARITAIDLSRSSLAYAKRQSSEAGISNVDFYHGDILDVKKLGKNFDFIESSGVLHHMKEPLEGWKALLSCLRPGGRMQIALYSTIARKAIRETRDYIKEKGYPATTEGIRQLRRDIIEAPADHPLKPVLTRRDFYNTSECRDLLFHVQEHTYVLPEIMEMLDTLGLAFLGFKTPRRLRNLYQKHFPTDPPMMDIENWIKLEEDNPDLFIGMYTFFCCRKDEVDTPVESWVQMEKTRLLRS